MSIAQSAKVKEMEKQIHVLTERLAAAVLRIDALAERLTALEEPKRKTLRLANG